MRISFSSSLRLPETATLDRLEADSSSPVERCCSRRFLISEFSLLSLYETNAQTTINNHEKQSTITTNAQPQQCFVCRIARDAENDERLAVCASIVVRTAASVGALVDGSDVGGASSSSGVAWRVCLFRSIVERSMRCNVRKAITVVHASIARHVCLCVFGRR
jgi:hypothetical protein